MAAKAKSKAKSKAKGKPEAAASVAAVVLEALQIGDRVRVLAGEWGNARGELQAVRDGKAHVKLEGDAHNDTVRPFEVSNLAPALGHFDR